MTSILHKNSLYKNLMLLFGFIMVLSCSKDDPEIVIFEYASDNFEVDFRTEDTIATPAINWPEEPGSFSLKTPIQGLSINGTTGAISIGRNLQAGEHEVVVMAKSDSKSWETHFLLTSVLKYSYWAGGRNNDPDSDVVQYDTTLQLYEDGTLEVELIGEDGSQGVGVWSIEGNNIQIHLCMYCSDMNPQDIPQTDEHSYFEGVLDNEMLIAEIKGEWFVVRFGPDSTSLRGNFAFEWD